MKKSIRWLAVFLWMGVIFLFSNEPDLRSKLPSVMDLILRKLAHMSEFYVLAYLFERALNEHRVSFFPKLAGAFIFSFFSAVFDEYHQTYVSGRHGSLIDIAIDSIGAAFFVILFIRNYRIKKRHV